MASIKFGQIIGIIKSDFNNYLMLWVIILIAGLISGLGSFVVIGWIFTVPFSIMIQGAAMAEFERTRGGN